MHKYSDIQRVKPAYVDVFSTGEHITITEKVDGSSAAFFYDKNTDSLKANSRNVLLDENNTLRGFFNFVKTLDKDIVKSVLGTRYVVHGEWLQSHSVKYPEDKYGKFYVFDVWDREIDQYVPWTEVKIIAEFIGLTTVPLFYDGSFESWEHIKSFVGRTELGAMPCGEGVVIKSQDRLDNKYSKTPAYLKFVSEHFTEIHSRAKTVDPEKMAKKEAELAAAQEIVTKRRVEK